MKILFQFKIEGQPDDAPLNEKIITLIINPDPKSLWKSVNSDKNDPYWKEDSITQFSPLGDRYILVSSKRGRSHANLGLSEKMILLIKIWRTDGALLW